MPDDLQAAEDQFYRNLARRTTRGLTEHLEAELAKEQTRKNYQAKKKAYKSK